MSTENEALAHASDTLANLIAALRGTPLSDDPAIQLRIGRIDTAIAAARAAAEEGHGDEASLLAATALRQIASDYPQHATAPSDLLGEDRVRRRIARRALEPAA